MTSALTTPPVLKLIYHTGVFGPIHLEYDQPVIRVGRSEDNDLVLRHPSVDPYHCLLVFRGEKLLFLAPDPALTSDDDLARLEGPQFNAGDEIMIGPLRFALAHSTRTVAIPHPQREDTAAQAEETDVATGSDQARRFCAHCRKSFPAAELKRLGLVGHAKHWLCPKCGRVLDAMPAPPKPASVLSKWLRRATRSEDS